MTIASASLWRLAVGVALLAGLLSCSQAQGRTTPVDTTPPGPSPAEPTGSDSTAVPAVKIEMTRENRFFPDVLVVRPGDTVEWTNNSDVPHGVTNDPAVALHREDVSGPPSAPPFDSGYVLPGHTFRHRFTQEGEYRYACFLHEAQGMTGRIVVAPQPGP
jgi:plastocyanin